MKLAEWGHRPGAYVLVDGQFGSTGKGLLAGAIAEAVGHQFTDITTNAGPNSGHTAYFGSGADEKKIVTQQVPVASVICALRGIEGIRTWLNAGAVIDETILLNEIPWLRSKNPTDPQMPFVHPCAAIINASHRALDGYTVDTIAGTGKGVGPAIAEKVNRIAAVTAAQCYTSDPEDDAFAPFNIRAPYWDWNICRVFVETAQGFSLGLNTQQFYPNVTSRECTVMQALSDARIPAQMLRSVVMTLRTYPIRVGNTAGSSGNWYPDQRETTWDAIGVPAEMTTVTKRVRRVATFSYEQFHWAVAANRPNILFLNFCNYLSKADLVMMIDKMDKIYMAEMGRPWDQLILGFGPRSSDLIDATQVDQY